MTAKQIVLTNYTITEYSDGVIHVFDHKTKEAHHTVFDPAEIELLHEALRLRKIEKTIMDVAEYNYATYHKHESSTQHRAIERRT